MYQNMMEPIQIGGLTFKNRIVFAPTTMGLAEPEYLKKIERIAASGVAEVIIGDVAVQEQSGRSLHSKEGMERYRRITEVIHSGGAMACAQLFCSDYSRKKIAELVLQLREKKITPDDMRQLMNDSVSETITSMSVDEIEEIVQGFGETARLAVEAGFDLVQIHGDRMGGSFSSSVYNLRTDAYGGSPERRAKFVNDAVRAVKSAVPEMTVDFKLCVRQENPHYGNAGVLLEEVGTFVRSLEESGVDSFHVTLANHSKLRDTIPPADHPEFREEGCFLSFADEVKRHTTLPVCGVGKLHSPDFIDDAIGSGRVELAAMSRQLIADNEWMRKVTEEKLDQIRSCIYCNKRCLGGMQSHEGVGCIYEEDLK